MKKIKNLIKMAMAGFFVSCTNAPSAPQMTDSRVDRGVANARTCSPQCWEIWNKWNTAATDIALVGSSLGQLVGHVHEFSCGTSISNIGDGEVTMASLQKKLILPVTISEKKEGKNAVFNFQFPTSIFRENLNIPIEGLPMETLDFVIQPHSANEFDRFRKQGVVYRGTRMDLSGKTHKLAAYVEPRSSESGIFFELVFHVLDRNASLFNKGWFRNEDRVYFVCELSR